MDSRSSSLSWGMRESSAIPEGEEMSEVQSDPSHGEGEGPMSRAKRERGLHRLRESPGIQSRTLRTSLGTISGAQEEGEGEEAAEGSEVRQLRDLWNQDQEDYANQVLSSLLGR